jgi:7,8-dihydropterin-6-yl-methyl-4-(beta-D-ribofuranosyl)aminobenzene 5'-phosphate synthase
VIFDTGDSAQTWANADALGADLREVMAVVLSHGHYDHTNGLPALLRRIGRSGGHRHPGIFERHMADRAAAVQYIGPPASREELEALGAIFRLSAEP